MKFKMRYLAILLLLGVVAPLIIFSGSTSALVAPSVTPTPEPANYTIPTFPSFFNCTFGISVFPGADPVGVYSIHVNPFYTPAQAQSAKPLIQFSTANAYTHYDGTDDGYTMDYGGFATASDSGYVYYDVLATLPILRTGNTTGTTSISFQVTRDQGYRDGSYMGYGFESGCYDFDNPLVFSNGESSKDLNIDLCSSETHEAGSDYYLDITILPSDSYDIGPNNVLHIHTYGTGISEYY
jgi:hypothetical protein